MHRRPLALLAVLLLAGPVAANGPRTDEQTLRAAGLPADDATLVGFFRQRTQPAAADRLVALVQDLGDPSAEKRDRAAGELVAVGPPAVPLLRQAARDPDDVPRSVRARQCLRFLEGEPAGEVPAAAARLLARRRSPDAADALLAYLPFADDDTVLEEVRNALVSLAVADGRLNLTLRRYLGAPAALQRATAAEVLGIAGGPLAASDLRPLLNDPCTSVRLRVALTLAREGHDPDAVAVLIALLTDAAAADARRAEDYLQALAGEQAPKVPLRDAAADRQKCRDAWAAWWKGTDRPGLLDEVRRRTVSDEARARVEALVKQLGDPSVAVREKATAELRKLGDPAVQLLRAHVHDPDPEVSARAARVVAAAKTAAPPLSPVVVRLIALRKPAGAAEALLACLPVVEDDALVSEVQETLAALAVRDEPALVRALDDPRPLRRGVAAAALWQAGVDRPAARKLLQDREPEVRLRVARALAASRDREAVPVLIDLLAELSVGPAAEVDDYLQRVAEDRGPDARPGPDEASRRKCRDAWRAWWQARGATADLPAPDLRQGQLGYTLVTFLSPPRVLEVGPDQKPRWEITDAGYCYDAQPLSGNRVLLAEYGTGRVSERTARGEVVWQKPIPQPINCQRLPNGHTVIGSRTGVVEVDRAGNEVFTLARPQGDLMAARRARDGTVYWVDTQGMCQHLEAGGKEIRSFPVGQVGMGALEVLPGGHVLVAQCNDYRVAEYDGEGKVVWSAPVAMPATAARLPNGHTLVGRQSEPGVVELDRAGTVVWEFRTGQQPWRVRRR